MTEVAAKSVYKTGILTIGRTYYLEFDFTITTVTYLTETFGNFADAYTTNGHKTKTFVASNTGFGFTGWGGHSGTIDNVTIKEILNP